MMNRTAPAQDYMRIADSALLTIKVKKEHHALVTSTCMHKAFLNFNNVAA